jgi:hypothetical protein
MAGLTNRVDVRHSDAGAPLEEGRARTANTKVLQNRLGTIDPESWISIFEKQLFTVGD